MSLKTLWFKSRWFKNHWAIAIFSFLIALFVLSEPVSSKQQKERANRLPPAPDNGSPEEAFSAGGTRGGQLTSLCSGAGKQIRYLLGNRNREYTAAAYPTFWFYLPREMNEVDEMRFELTELETGKEIYNHAIQVTDRSGVIGVSLPREKQYALVPRVNYAWNLEVNCAGAVQNSPIALEGWLSRIAVDSQLESQLAASSEAEKVKVYLQHNLLYDALTQQAQRMIAKPNNTQTAIAWNQLLTTLGWQDLIQHKSATQEFIVDTKICSKRNHH